VHPFAALDHSIILSDAENATGMVASVGWIIVVSGIRHQPGTRPAVQVNVAVAGQHTN
jgi:hypothetical protein